MHKKFDSKTIEKKWQNKWEEEKIYQVGERDKTKEKKYILVEWPYPSGNLHIGHWYAFAIPDIYARYFRMQGKQVLFPIGFDAFGLPAENAAIRHKTDPKSWTTQNIAYMKEQLRSMGNSFSTDKTTNSIDEEYYKWTQWMFTKFFEKGIAYRGKGKVNWCGGCHTVIANEQVVKNVAEEDTCERCGSVVEKREMPQWMLKITDFADDLIDDLDELDWPNSIKEMQKRWIGRSKGAEIDFSLNINEKVTVFTTRPDTLFGATYLVLAPEHELLEKNKEKIENWEEVEKYLKQAKQKAEQDRLDETKEKTGVKIEGVSAKNPVSGKEIPIFVADYVLGGYGTGAIMAVPAHDARDFAFAQKFSLPIVTVISGGEEGEVYTGGGKLINSEEFSGLNNEEAKEKITKKAKGKLTATYRLRDWSVGRQRYWGVPIPIVYDKEGKAKAIPEKYLPWVLPEDVDFTPTGEPPLKKSEVLKKRVEDIFGEGFTPEVETMDTFVDSSWYFLRYIDSHNDKELVSLEKQKDWLPVDMYFGGAEHTTMHLLYSRFWQKALFSLGLVKDKEPYLRRINRGLILGPDGNKMSKSKGNVIDPDKQVEQVGADTVRMYLAFMGPYEGANYPFDLGGVAGIRRFLERVYGLSDHFTETEPEVVTKLLHKTIKKTKEDIEQFKFNTIISQFMVFVNLAEKETITKASFRTFLKLLAPFAPHLTEELWREGGFGDKSIHLESFPQEKIEYLEDKTVTLGVQINGKTRISLEVDKEAEEVEVRKLVEEKEELQKFLEGKEIVKFIYKKGKIISVVVK